MSDYDQQYYNDNNQSGDRLALGFYYRLFKRHLKPVKGAKQLVLEYGSGVGHLTKRLVRNYDTTALDISSYALSQVNSNAPEANTIDDISKVKNKSLDGVIALHVMEHIEVPKKVFDQFYKKLKPQGVLVFVVPNPDGIGRKLKGDKWFGFQDETHISLLGVEEWLGVVRESGFDVTKYAGDGMWDVPYISWLPSFLQKMALFPLPALQVCTGLSFLPTKVSECLIVVARKP